MIYLLTSHGSRGTGLTVSAVSLALALYYSEGKRVLLCDFQYFKSRRLPELINGCKNVLLGHSPSSVHRFWDQDFNDMLGLADHGLLSLSNLTNYTLQVTPEPGLDLVEWRSNATAEVLSRPVFSAVMRLAAQRYECIVVDFGEVEPSEVEGLKPFKDAKWIYHENQVTLGNLHNCSRLDKYAELFNGIIIGKGIPGKHKKGLENKLRSRHCGSITISSEVPEHIAERGLERLFRRALADRRGPLASSIVTDATRLAKRLDALRQEER